MKPLIHSYTPPFHEWEQTLINDQLNLGILWVSQLQSLGDSNRVKADLYHINSEFW